MKLNTLKPANGSIKGRKRIGRGQGSGRGGTSTKGHKGAQSRAGYKSKPGFEGGQMPIQRRVPKFGFNRPQKVVFKPVNLDILQNIVEKTDAKIIDVELLLKNGLIGKKDRVKVLGRGELKTKVDVSAHQFSAAAVDAIEKLGGKVTRL
ncbi:MAG: 50S ribosomal protein L15 [Cyclobacteriaceae bacterium]|nr:50S ribosomal protein L15 [Cyclobacteriaceae bacterium]